MEAVHPTTFGTLLRRYRLAAELTQEQLAERAGVSARRLGDLERGVPRMPRASTLALLAEALRLSPEEAQALTTAARLVVPVVHTVPTHGERALPPFVGRTAEVALLQAHLAGSGPPLLLLAGEPGIGKSRLLLHAAQQARAAGWRVLSGGCQRRGGQESYAPLPEALAAALAGQTPTQLRQILGGCAWLVRLLPELAGGLIEPLPGWAMAPADERRLIFAAVQRFLSNLAGPAGTLLVLDDLQWAGADALELLASLVRARGLPLRLVGAYRETEVQPGDPLAMVLADLGQAGLARRRQVQPLAPDEVVELLDGLLGDRQELAAQLAQRSGGVPFFLVSCAQAVREAPEQAAAIPWDVAEGIRQRVVALAPLARQVVGAAAIGVERTAHLPVLAAVLEQPEREVLAGLEEGRRARLLDEVAGGYRIAHDLIREVLEADLGSAGRMLLHRRTAEVLEEQAARSSRAPSAEVLAYHFTRSDRPERAVGYLEQAGDQAQAQQGRAAAEGFYRETVEMLDSVGRSLDAARVREKLGALLYDSDRYATALAVLELATETYRAVGDLEATGRVVAVIAHVYIRLGTNAEGLARVAPMLAVLAPRGASQAVAALYLVQSQLLGDLGRFHEQRAAAEEGARICKVIGDHQQLALALLAHGIACYSLWRLSEAALTLAEAMQVAEAAGDRAAMVLCYDMNNIGGVYEEQGSFAASKEIRERALQLAQQHSFRAVEAMVTSALGWMDFLCGDWVAARGRFEQAFSIGRELGYAFGDLVMHHNLGTLCLAEGADAEAAPHLEECDRLLRTGKVSPVAVHFHLPRILAERDLLTGRPEEARSRLAHALEGLAPDAVEGMPLLHLLAWALHDLGEVDAAAEVAERAVRMARDLGAWLLLVDTLRVAAMIEVRQERWGAAADWLQEGLSLAREMGYLYGEARLLRVAGDLYVQLGQPELARERLAGALALARRLGARRVAEQAEYTISMLR